MNKDKLKENKEEGIKLKSSEYSISATNVIPSMRELTQEDCDKFVEKIKKQRGINK